MTEQAMIDFVGRERTRLLVAERAGGGLVGYLMVDASDEEETVVVRLTVAEESRRQGVGLSLLERAEQLARKAKASRLALYAYENDRKMHGFLQSCELTAESVRRHYGAEGAFKFTLKLGTEKSCSNTKTCSVV